METAVAHGYLMARVDGYAAKRARQRGHVERPAEDWASALAALSGKVGRAGGRESAPSDSPVVGLTSETFRAEVAAMRAAEYDHARKPH